MSAKQQTQSAKRSRFWLITGLLGLLAGIIALMAFRMRKNGWLWVIRASEYAPYLDWIVAQSQHETNGWKSGLFIDDKNLFGMKVPLKRKFFGHEGRFASDGGYYARYDSWADSAKDLLSWLRYNNFPTDLVTVDQYVDQLKADNYFGDTKENYLAGVKRWLKIGYDKNLKPSSEE